jgi:aminoglycoside phosphotransferase family enzyme
VAWRWRLRARRGRARRIHGDFHPFNILVDGDADLALLDASRGCAGDPADDVVCLAVNFVFFAVGHEAAWTGALGPLWHRFWRRYLEGSGDRELLEIAPVYLAWRCLVLVNPLWYPAVAAAHRRQILALAERALGAGRLELPWADEVMAAGATP